MDADLAAVATHSTEISPARGARKRSSILLVVPLPVRYDSDGRLLIESQAANGLERYADNFETVTAACILTPESKLNERSTWTWRLVDEIPCADRAEVLALPWAYRPSLFVHHYRATRRKLSDLIQKSDYLFFGIGYSWGDWAALGCVEALRLHRPYAVWTDLVDYQVIRFDAGKKPLLRKLYGKCIDATIVKHYHQFLISKCQLGLFHGRDCFDAYAPFCSNPHIVHNIHLKRQDAIGAETLQEKVAEIRAGGPLKIGYVGRADATKGAWDWLEVCKQLLHRGIDLDATWLGDGPLLPELRAKVAHLGLEWQIHFPGFVADRTEVMAFLRKCHLLVFCHKVPESPRILIESPVCGTPIVGYDSPYPRDLIADRRWGKVTPQHDITALAEAIAQLDRSRGTLAEMAVATSAAAHDFNDEAVFRHRCDLIKQFL